MSMFPPSTNDTYYGSGLAAGFLVLTGVMTVAPGLIHFFLPDGGAGVIAHMDLSTRRETIFAMFAWMGAMQIPHGLVEIVVGLRYRSLTPLFLAMVLIERGLMSFDGWLGKASLTGHHPPEHYASVVSVLLTTVFLVLSLRRRPAA